jgi:Rrf2 family protein
MKCQYGLRALHELSRNWGQGLLRIPDIAAAQHIPERFLENILNQLRSGGFVESRRGRGGGFRLAKAPSSISIADIVRFVDGQIYSVDCESASPPPNSDTRDSCVFLPLWREARDALEKVYSGKNLQDLLDDERKGKSLDFCI